MTGKEIDPSDIGKHPNVIRVAQNDMAQTDVLVCGKCHCVFHFTELFQEHKDIGCEKDSEFRDNRESKPKVWAFLLWKAAQLNSGDAPVSATNSWKLYQQWVKMDDSVRETWIVAGKTIQSFAKMGQGNLQEMPVKITKTVVDNTPSMRAMSTPKPGQRIADSKQIFKKDLNTDNEDEMSPIRPEQSRVIRKPISQINQTKPPPNSIVNKPITRRANRTVPKNGQEVEEETVEKIIAKRFNPRRKMHEYLVKWEGYPHDQNTWEPQTHLESCPLLLETFEKQLARQKEQRAAQAAKQAAQAAAIISSQQTTLPTLKDTPASPARQAQLAQEAKTRVLDGKTWTSQDEVVGSLKRKMNDSEEFDESGGNDDSVDIEENATPANKRLRNGSTILRMDSSGDIKISQAAATTKSLNGKVKSTGTDSSAEVIITKDNQSSGIVKKTGIVPNSTQKPEVHVRILPKGDNGSSGIVRLNKSPASGGVTTVQTRITQTIGQRDSPAIQRPLLNSSTPSPRPTVGQTRIVQRTTASPAVASQQATKAFINRVSRPQTDVAKSITPEQKIIQLSQKNDLKVTRKIIHPAQSQPTRPSPQELISKLAAANDLPDDPFPEPQSPPRPLTLCPVTGKVLAQAEGEPSPVPSPEPEKKPIERPLQGRQAQQAQQANITSVGILQTNNVHEDHAQEVAEGIPEGMALTTEDGQQHILTSEDGTPLLVTGEDGTIYQVAGKNAEGQTILIAQGADGEQQYAYVATADGDEGGVLTLDNAVAEAVAQMLPEQQAEALAAAASGETQYILKQDDGATAGSVEGTEALTIQTGDGGDSQDGNIPAEVVQADLPSPGGTRRVVLLLQDGTFMMTEMHDDEYQALNIVT